MQQKYHCAMITFFAGLTLVSTNPADASDFWSNPDSSANMLPPLYYVRAYASGANNGSSWEDAFNSIQDAIDAADGGGSIWVAYGMYLEAITLTDGVQLYGGFTGVEDERDVVYFPSVIDASSAGDGGDAANHVVTLDGISDARIDGFTITGGKADVASFPHYRGAGILCMELDSSNSIANCTISGNEAFIYEGGEGAGIYFFNSSPSVTNCTVIGNIAGDHTNQNNIGGGGIYFHNSSPTLTDCQIIENYSYGFAGGIFCDNSSPTLVNCAVSNNSTNAYSGGGIYFYFSSTATLTDCFIEGNTSFFGGGVYFDFSSPVLANCSVNANTAAYSGGGILCYQSSPSLTNCLIDQNAAEDGGGIYCYQSSPTFDTISLASNGVEFQGGGVYCDESSPSFINSTIADNTAGSGGGGLCSLYSSAPMLNNCVVSANVAPVGAGVLCQATSPVLSSCTISANTATNVGAGIYAAFSGLILTNCILSANYAGDRGGAFYSAGNVDGVLLNCTISRNSAASSGGGMFLNGNTGNVLVAPTLTNCIFEGNTHHALFEYSQRVDPVVHAGLFYGNPDGDWRDYDTNETISGAAAINALPEATDCVEGNPLFQMDSPGALTGTWTGDGLYDWFINRTWLWDHSAPFVPGALVGQLIVLDAAQPEQALIVANSDWTIQVVGDYSAFVTAYENYKIVDYHLTIDSAANDAGSSSGAPAVDIDGEGRPVGAEMDIGADEFLDTDGDMLSDWLEKAYDGDSRSYNPYPSGDDLDFGQSDTDGDGLGDGLEISVYGTMANDDDSDEDGYRDGEEIEGGGDPNAANSIPRNVAYVDFSFIGSEIGSQLRPYNSVAEGMGHVRQGGRVKIRGDSADTSTTETPRIGKRLRLEAVEGTVHIGL